MTPLLAEGLNLALYGMGTVFVFLTMLVFATMLISWIISKTTTTVLQGHEVDSLRLAAITAAVHQHRNKS